MPFQEAICVMTYTNTRTKALIIGLVLSIGIPDSRTQKPFSENDLDAATSTVGSFFQHAIDTLYGS